MSQASEWLEISGRQPGLASPSGNKIKYVVKGPLYAASAVFERTIQTEGRWAIAGAVEASLPLRGRWSESVTVSGDFSRTPSFELHLEQIAGGAPVSSWSQTAHGLELKEVEGKSGVVLETGAVPFVSSADLFFLLHDVWRPCPVPRGLFVVAARKTFALRLKSGSDGRILGEIAAVVGELPPNRDWGSVFLESLQSKVHEFLLEWSEVERQVTGFEVRVPLLGRIKAKLV